ncbi:HAD-like protein [Stereum hirsutum FP-91666 SS1]|uniref:HAD-like protein n=1 Tax=Stereum hirsutum (strain FP-91666) TaxID=721885 RepID=UPI000444934E|nr:HAD-like protein [Stereum hirsutum FP-91666 SS1]EIM81301.1 HAD-like protein [Stereum hirsutum FP-91666 SS1]
MAPTKNIEYVLFDMDGLILDSEQIYTDVTNIILADYGEKMTWEMKAGCMGKPELEAAHHLLSFFPHIPLSTQSYLSRRNTLQDALWPTVSLLPGSLKLIKHLHAHDIPMAIATGSRRRNYEMKTGHLGEVFGCFGGRVVCGDDEWIREKGGKGKPGPDCFLVAAREVLGRNVGGKGGECNVEEREERSKGLVFEDAIPGVIAGKRAGMNVVWVPDPNLLKLDMAGTPEVQPDQMLNSLEEFKPEEWGLPPYDSDS